MIKIGKVIGDVIEAGGVKNVTNNYYDSKPEGHPAEVHLSKDDLPDKLRWPEAEELMEDLVDAGLLTEDWQPKGLSGSERGLLAREVCTSLGINDVWQVFGKLWNEKPETLRSHLNKALDQKKSLQFQEKLKNIIH